MSNSSENPFQFIAADAQTGVQQRIEQQRRLQNQARRTRRRLRWALRILAVSGIALMAAGGHFEIGWLAGIGFLCLFLCFPVFVALFFYGGWMPTTIRWFLTDRQKQLLDD